MINDSYLYREGKNWSVYLQDCTDVDTGTPVLFCHLETDGISKSIIRCLRETLEDVLREREMDVSFFTNNPKIVRIAKTVKELDYLKDFRHEGIKHTAGIWEYNQCQ